MKEALSHPSALLLLQLLLIVAAARMAGWLFRKLGQPSVIGEILAGIALGPSLLGRFTPAISAQLFPVASLGTLQQLSNVGLILFMFIIGMELDFSLVKGKGGKVLAISQAGIIIPFGLGAVLARPLYNSYAPPGVPFFVFALFTGIAMSITAFPVLARIIRERGMMGTRLGTLTLTCAAADDVVAWCLLALITAIAKGASGAGFGWMLLYTAIYIGAMFGLVKPLLAYVAGRLKNGALSFGYVSLLFCVLLLSALATELIGLHALFGAFLAGIILPKSLQLRHALIEKTEAVATGLLLPLFFVSTGLRTNIAALGGLQEWGWCGLIILTAVAGKLGGCTIAARLSGERWRDSIAIGALMNTRGLMQLVVLTIGYDLGIISPTIFTMMVLMAIVTTMMTAPLLRLTQVGWTTIFKTAQ